MILVDPRVGSKDLEVPLRERGLPVQLQQMDYGDVAWVGQGATHPITVGVERKRLSDLLSCITDGRYTGHQLPGLVANYEINYLIVEGMYRCADNGHFHVWQGKAKGWAPVPWGKKWWMWNQVEHWLQTMEAKCGIVVKKTSGKTETLATIHSLYSWWQTPWENHTAHLAFDRPRFNGTGINFTTPSPARLIAKEIPMIGWERSAAVARRFPTGIEMASAPVHQWEEIDGIGPKIAQGAYDFFRRVK